MIRITDEEFGKMVEAAVADIPLRFASHLVNIAFRIADEPTRAQLQSGGNLHGNMTLLGLYEGVPLPLRGGGYSGMVPDIITIFKNPHLLMSGSTRQLRIDVRQTVWHEVAHYFGLDHGQIHALEA